MINVFPILLGYVVIVLGSFVFVLEIGVKYFFLLRKEQDKRKKKVVGYFGLIFFLPLAILFGMAFVHFFFKLNNDYLLLFSSMHIILLFGFTLIYLKQFMTAYHGSLEVEKSIKDKIVKISEKFNLSKREQEVVQLICEGESNKEIGDKLYLSLLTVKGYVFKIYQKTDVKNRVQLSNLFRDQ